jgi:hypothetical protein
VSAAEQERERHRARNRKSGMSLERQAKKRASDAAYRDSASYIVNRSLRLYDRRQVDAARRAAERVDAWRKEAESYRALVEAEASAEEIAAVLQTRRGVVLNELADFHHLRAPAPVDYSVRLGPTDPIPPRHVYRAPTEFERRSAEREGLPVIMRFVEKRVLRFRADETASGHAGRQ